jgi:CRP-like cAMP-binding protein
VLLTALQEFPTESLRFKQLADERAATITRSASVKRIQAMADLEFFKGSAPGFLQLLERQVEERAYMAGQELMVEGEEGSTLYVLLSGEVSVLVGGVPVNKPKDDMPIFGEGSILTSAPRTATVTATTLCSVKLLHKQVLLDAFDRFPEERAKLEQHMFRRKRELAASLHRRKSVDKFTGSTLQQCEHFRQCPLHILAELAAQANSFVFHHGDEIVTEDQAASNSDYLMILQRGVALATSRGVKVGELKQNSTWCEDVVLEVSNKHLSTVRAMTTCVVQLIPGQAVRDALEYDDEEHERLFNVAISMRKTVMLLTMAERGIDAAEALRIAGGAGGFKKKQDQANQDKEDPNKTGHRFRKIQRAKKFLDRAKNAHAQGDAPQAHAKASTQKAANAKSAGGKISAALQSMKALTGLKLGSQGGPALLRGTALMNLMKESHGEPSATGELRQQNEAAPDSSDEEERSRGVTSLSTSLRTVRALKRLRSTNKDPQAGQASGRKETSELLKSKSFCREMDLQRKNGEVFFMDLPVRGTTVREVEREREQNLILRAAIDYSKRDTVNPAPSYERRYNESSHRVFVLSQTCLSAGDLLKGTMRDVNRTVMRRRSQSPLQLPPLVSAVPAEDRAGLTPESFSDPDS